MSTPTRTVFVAWLAEVGSALLGFVRVLSACTANNYSVGGLATRKGLETGMMLVPAKGKAREKRSIIPARPIAWREGQIQRTSTLNDITHLHHSHPLRSSSAYLSPPLDINQAHQKETTALKSISISLVQTGNSIEAVTWST